MKRKAEGEQAQEQYQTVESSQLSNKPPKELVQIIYRYDAEVKRLHKVLDESKVSSFDLSKAREETQLYKMHMEALQKHAQGVSEELEDMKLLLDSRAKEIGLLKGQLGVKDKHLSQLTDQARERETNEMQAAQQSIKRLEKEVIQKAVLTSSLQDDIILLMDKAANLERDCKETDLALHKERLEAEASRGELIRVNFQRQSLETEVKALKESLARTDEKLRQKESKLDDLQNTLLEKQTELTSLRQEGEAQRFEFTRSASLIEETACKEVEKLQAALQAEREGRKQDSELMQSQIDKISSELTATEEKARTQASNGGYAEVELKLLRQTCESAINRANTLEVEKAKLDDSLIKLQQKREMAKAEVLRLSQRLETQSSPGSKQWMKINPTNVQPQDWSTMVSIGHELEVLYKQLMTMMMNARTSGGSKFDYLISSDEFSQFERRLNNLFVQVHDCIDVPEMHPEHVTPEQVQPEPPQSWGTKLSGAVSSIRQSVTGRGPVKLFSCMTGDSNHHPKTAQGRNLRSNTGEPKRKPQVGPSRLS